MSYSTFFKKESLYNRPTTASITQIAGGETSVIKMTPAKIEPAENYLNRRIDELYALLNRTVVSIHHCANCGGTLEVPANNGVFYCKYCGSPHTVNTVQLNSTY